MDLKGWLDACSIQSQSFVLQWFIFTLTRVRSVLFGGCTSAFPVRGEFRTFCMRCGEG